MQAHFKEVKDRISIRSEEKVYRLKMQGVYNRTIAGIEKHRGLQDDHPQFGGRQYDGYMETDKEKDKSLYTWNFVGVERLSWIGRWRKESPRILVRVETFSRVTNKLQDEQYYIIDHDGNTERTTNNTPGAKIPLVYEANTLHMPKDYQSYQLVMDASNTVLGAPIDRPEPWRDHP